VEYAEVIVNGSVISTRIRFLAREGDKAAFALVSHNLSRFDENRQAESVNAAVTYLLTLFFRIDLFDEDGSVQNIYLDSMQERITDSDTNAVSTVALYARLYIREEERARFCSFYDMNTIHSRVARSGKTFVSDYYHSGIPGEENRIQMYTILPFRSGDHWKMLSICRYISGEENEIRTNGYF
jgi:hypothetical protein